MKKQIQLTSLASILLIITTLFLAGCGTPVMINSNPTGASVYSKGAQVGTTPFQTPKVGQIAGSWVGELRMDGYVNKPIWLSSGQPAEVTFNLEFPKVTLSSTPSGADIFAETGEKIGQTPMVISVANTIQNYTLRLLSYNSKNVTLNPTSPSTVEVNMGTQIPGYLLPEVTVADKGLQVQFSTVFADSDVIERSPSVKAIHRLSDFPATRWVGGSALSPDGKRLLMDVLDQEPAPDGTLAHFSNLWAIDVSAGGRLQRFTEGHYFNEAPTFSPDGQFTYFSSSRAGKNSIFRMSAINQGGGYSMVTSGTTIDRYPQISPDGHTLLWTAYTQGSTVPQLWSLQLAANGLPTGLPLQLREGQEGRWSPDGKTVLYCVMDRNIGKLKIWTMQPDGSQPTQLTTASDCNDIHPAWSPDGTKIFFASDRGISNGTQNYDIWMMNADGSNPKQLTTNGSRDDHPIVSSDGKTIFFRSNRGLQWNIWVMELAE